MIPYAKCHLSRRLISRLDHVGVVIPVVISDLVKLDNNRIKILTYVAELGLPDCWVAAGFVRNLIWDHLHSIPSTPLNDVDVIFYDRMDSEDLIAEKAQTLLYGHDQTIKWEVKNQAFMHLKNSDPPYQSSKDAMSYWPEIETAIGVRLAKNGDVEVCAPFGVSSLFSGKVTANPRRSYALVKQRAEKKGWFERWPNLKFEPHQRL